MKRREERWGGLYRPGGAAPPAGLGWGCWAGLGWGYVSLFVALALAVWLRGQMRMKRCVQARRSTFVLTRFAELLYAHMPRTPAHAARLAKRLRHTCGSGSLTTPPMHL